MWLLLFSALREAQEIFGLDFDPEEFERMADEGFLVSDEEDEEDLEESQVHAYIRIYVRSSLLFTIRMRVCGLLVECLALTVDMYFMQWNLLRKHLV